MASWQWQWLFALGGKNNVLLKGFRGSRKTTIVRGLCAWSAIYQHEPYQIVQSYEDSASAEWVRQVAVLITKPQIVADYGQLFPFETRKEDMAKASLKDWELTNGSKVMSRSLGQTLRGANSDTGEYAQRPTLLILDDIDTAESVRNSDIISQNELKILGETIGALDPLRRRVIFLGNVILEDGVVPRFIGKYKESKNWQIFEQALFGIDWVNVWPEVFTEEVVAKLRDLEQEIAFAQNYLLLPYASGQKIIGRQSILHRTVWPDDAQIYIGVDPAFSLKTNTDALWVVISAHYGDERYVIDAFAFEGQDKNEAKVVPWIVNQYTRYKAAGINIETNNGWEIIGRALQNSGCIVNFLKSTRDKVERLREHEGRFGRGSVFFMEDTENLQEQLLAFPSKWVKDDLVDAMVFSFSGGQIYAVV